MAAEQTIDIVLTGGCQCGAIRYTVKPRALPTSHTFCHCRTCQRISGSAFLPFVHFPATEVEIHSRPVDALKAYEASKYAERQFCGICGSTISMQYYAADDRISLAVASFDDKSTTLLPELTEHIYVSEKAPWFPLSDDDGISKHDTMEQAEKYLNGQSSAYTWREGALKHIS